MLRVLRQALCWALAGSGALPGGITSSPQVRRQAAGLESAEHTTWLTHYGAVCQPLISTVPSTPCNHPFPVPSNHESVSVDLLFGVFHVNAICVIFTNPSLALSTMGQNADPFNCSRVVSSAQWTFAEFCCIDLSGHNSVYKDFYWHITLNHQNLGEGWISRIKGLFKNTMPAI